MINEEQFFNQVFDKFVKISEDQEKSEVWKDRSFIDLMNILKKDHDEEFVQNALVVIMALFEDHLNDSFYTNSEDVKDLTENEKLEVIDDLKEALAI